MSVSAIYSQSLERDRQKHLQGSLKEFQPFQPGSQPHWRPNFNASMQTDREWEISKRSQRYDHDSNAMISAASWRHRGMNPGTGVLGWKDTGSSGRTSRGDEDIGTPSVSDQPEHMMFGVGWMR